MISFDQFTLEDSSPIYFQIIRYIKRGIASGAIGDRAELPSRRVLSVRLGVNPNTVQKAYRLLEEEGIIVSHSGAKSYTCVDDARRDSIRAQLLELELRAAVRAMAQMGLGQDEALALVARLWEETE